MGVKLLIMVSYERNNHSKFPKTFIFSFIWPRKSKIGPKKCKIRKLPPPPYNYGPESMHHYRLRDRLQIIIA